MTFRVTPLTEQINERKFGEAAKTLAETLAAQGCNLAAAARVVGVNYRTMTRWLSTLKAAGHDVRAAAVALQKNANQKGPREPRVSALLGKSKAEQKRIVLAETRKANGNLAAVARALNVSRQGIYKRVAALGLTAQVDAISREQTTT